MIHRKLLLVIKAEISIPLLKIMPVVRAATGNGGIWIQSLQLPCQDTSYNQYFSNSVLMDTGISDFERITISFLMRITNILKLALLIYF